jgi:hypothetical protein
MYRAFTAGDEPSQGYSAEVLSVCADGEEWLNWRRVL